VQNQFASAQDQKDLKPPPLLVPAKNGHSQKSDSSKAENRPLVDDSISVAQQPTDFDRDVNRMVTRLILDSMPHTHTDERDWDLQRERFDGIKLRREGLRIETKRKKKLVNHGTWRRYSVALIDPDQHFKIAVKNIRGKNGKVLFDVDLAAYVKLDGRQSKWVNGIQLYSVSLEGKSKLRMTVAFELDIDLDLTKLPPDVVIDPVATEAKIVVDEFRIDKVSKAGGEIAQQLTRAIRKRLDKNVDSKEAKVVEKINRAIDKKRDRLTISFEKARNSKWAKATKPLLSRTMQHEIDRISNNK